MHPETSWNQVPPAVQKTVHNSCLVLLQICLLLWNLLRKVFNLPDDEAPDWTQIDSLRQLYSDRYNEQPDDSEFRQMFKEIDGKTVSQQQIEELYEKLRPG